MDLAPTSFRVQCVNSLRCSVEYDQDSCSREDLLYSHTTRDGVVTSRKLLWGSIENDLRSWCASLHEKQEVVVPGFEKWEVCPCTCKIQNCKSMDVRRVDATNGMCIARGIDHVMAVSIVAAHNAQAPEPEALPDPVPSPGPWAYRQSGGFGQEIIDGQGRFMATMQRYHGVKGIVTYDEMLANAALILSVHDKQAALREAAEYLIAGTESNDPAVRANAESILSRVKRALDLKNYLPKTEKA